MVKILTAKGHTEEQVLSYGASAESGSDHPLAKVIVRTAEERGIPFPASNEARIVPGRGAECRLGTQMIRAGNRSSLAELGVEDVREYLDEADRQGATAVLVAAGGELAGAILLQDSPREGAAEAVHELEHLGIQRVILLTGDRRFAAEAMASPTTVTPGAGQCRHLCGQSRFRGCSHHHL